ncbi:alpha/beta hydrolase [Rhizobium ruizarguesonis]|uniref:alpha/beta fold hydrolase n=1 Tax=Rhizobium ruizarguesonis TaxID=2081791 RepID=UPI001031DFBF|nr:alpha/beta hydrolase [Rhizobium ruizarguesonis]TBC25041.1 alpha/beta hydrolase [Rhizobium ruizarguesonis]
MKVLLILLLLAGLVPLLRLALQSRVAWKHRLQGPSCLDETTLWSIGGITQAVQLRGWNEANPLLLYVHGGPGMPAMPFGHAFQSEWERHFTIVHWDQRLTGKTLCANGIETGLVLNDFAEDGVDLVRQLQQRFPGRPIGLVGHSWGTAVAIRMLQAAPELFAGYLAIGQVSDFLTAERYGYETVLTEARRRGAAALVTSLNRFPNYPVGNSLSHASLSAVRAAEVKLGFGHYRKQSVMLKLLWLAFVSPDYRWRDLLTLANSKAQYVCLDIALAELPQFVVRAAGVAIQCPVLMVGGAFDLFTPTPAAREFFETIHAPQKKLLEVVELAHFGPLEDAPLFNRIIIGEFLPMIVNHAASHDRSKV